MTDNELRSRIRRALDAEMSGLTVPAARRAELIDNAIGGRKVKRKLTVGLALAIALVLVTVTAAAVTVALLTAQQVVEDVAVPLARENDKEWRIVTDFSPEALAEFIRQAGENGIDLDENHAIMQAIRNGEGYDEEEAIMAVCRAAFGGNYDEWTLAQQHWFWDVMVEIGWAAENNVEAPGPDDLPEEEARARMIAAIRAEYGEDLPLEDRSRFALHLGYLSAPTEAGETWILNISPVVGDAVGETACYYASLDKAGNVKEVHATPVYLDPPVGTTDRAVPEFTLTEAEAVHIAAEGIRAQTGVDVPLEDEEKYRYVCYKQNNGTPGWHISFISLTGDWGYCTSFVNDATREVTVENADVDAVTADNILARYRAQYGWYDTWDSTVWAEIAVRAADLPAATMTGKVTRATPWIAWREGLMTRDEAEERAFRQTGVKMGEVNCVCLIDAEPDPVWKFRLLPWDGTYDDSIVVEIDAVTGEMTDLDLYKSDHQDLEPSFHMITLRRIWSRLEYEENGPLYIARLAVLHKFADNTFDMPEVDSIPIFDMRYWQPEIDGHTVRFVSRWAGQPDYEVELDEDGMAVRVEEKPSAATEEMPEELNLECVDESLYEVDARAQAEAQAEYGVDSRLWPLDVQMAVYPNQERTVPGEGEMTLGEAVTFARTQLPEEARAATENATDGAILYRLDAGTPDEFTRWTVFFYMDEKGIDCWRVTFVDKHPEGMEYLVDVKEPGDMGNG